MSPYPYTCEQQARDGVLDGSGQNELGLPPQEVEETSSPITASK